MGLTVVVVVSLAIVTLVLLLFIPPLWFSSCDW